MSRLVKIQKEENRKLAIHKTTVAMVLANLQVAVDIMLGGTWPNPECREKKYLEKVHVAMHDIWEELYIDPFGARFQKEWNAVFKVIEDGVKEIIPKTVYTSEDFAKCFLACSYITEDTPYYCKAVPNKKKWKELCTKLTSFLNLMFKKIHPSSSFEEEGQRLGDIMHEAIFEREALKQLREEV